MERLKRLISEDEHGDGILYSGSRQETVPRALLLDVRLTPLERNAWQVIRLIVSDGAVHAFPGYDELRPYLSSMPCCGRASNETIARALMLLRLTRWLTLARQRRDSRSGRFLGNTYVLHDEPLLAVETIEADAGYLELISHALDHASKAIQQVGQYTLHEISQDPLLADRTLPSRLQLLLRGARSDSEGGPSSESEGGPCSDSERGKHLPKTRVRKPNTAPLSSSCSTTTKSAEAAAAREDAPLRLPERFGRLRPEQQSAARSALQQLTPAQQQAVLDEWAIRCKANGVRHPAGYLFGIIQRALVGQFSASERDIRTARKEAFNARPAPPAAPAKPETVDKHLAHIRAILAARSQQ